MSTYLWCLLPAAMPYCLQLLYIMAHSFIMPCGYFVNAPRHEKGVHCKLAPAVTMALKACSSCDNGMLSRKHTLRLWLGSYLRGHTSQSQISWCLTASWAYGAAPVAHYLTPARLADVHAQGCLLWSKEKQAPDTPLLKPVM